MALCERGDAGRLSDHWHSPRRWVVIRQFYASVMEQILAGERIDVNASEIPAFMTPIERAVWGEIRANGLAFYPQFPVGRRFVDFGDPINQVAIEVDGKNYHTAEGDAQKDAELAALGWYVYRIPGRDALAPSDWLEKLFAELADRSLEQEGN
jgi:very-short-patch-repair endonuclease